jgi:hypothetical protein
MSPFLTPIITGAIDLIVGKIKEGASPAEAAAEVAKTVAPEVLKAEEQIASNAKDAWMAELHNGGLLATSWRPLAALVSIAGLAWEGFALPVLNTMVTINNPPEYVSTAFLYTLLTLIGVRGIEKINIVRKR